MSTNLDEPLTVATLNIRGIRNPKKRSTVLRNLKRERLDIVSLQETYLLSQQDERDIVSEWDGILHFSPADSHNSKGLVTLFNKKFRDCEINLIFKSNRVLISAIKINNENIFVVNVYSPSDEDKEKIKFLDELNKIVHDHIGDTDDHIIFLGDFNIAHSQLDVLSGNPHSLNTRQALSNFIAINDLTDTWRLAHPNEKNFSWSRGGTQTSAKRLDYIFVGESLLSYIRDSNIKSIGFSDHRLVYTTFDFTTFKYGKGLYKINTSHLKDQDYCSLIIKEIHDTINEYKNLDDHLIWEMIKINIKEASQRYGKFKSGENRDRANDLRSKLAYLDQCRTVQPNDQDILANIAHIKTELEILELEKTRGAQLRARVKDINEGEKCTKYFLALEKFNANTNTIKKIRCPSGVIIEDAKKIVQELGNQFKERYNQHSISKDHVSSNTDNFINDITLPSLDENERELCDSDIQEGEIAVSLLKMQNGSSPGSDGIPVEVYKMFWVHLKAPLLKAINHSLTVKKLPYSERLGIISLFHKGKDLDRADVNNWRPIALTNVDYKLIAKTLSLRLDKVINKLIGSQQVGFMKGRSISTIHRNIDDLLEAYRKLNLDGILLAIDFRQAFDTININFILKSLKVFGFGDKFIQWIEILNTDRLTCVKNGGHLSQAFPMTNGVRQGCPISPQLFILAVEILAQKILQDKNIKGLKPNVGVKSRKLEQYADDTSMYLKDTSDLKRAWGHLNGFSACSGLFLNLNKCFALSTNGKRFDTGGINIQFRDTVKILGLYFSNKRVASEIEDNWVHRIANIVKILKLWSRRKLSIIGKIHILKTFGLSQLVFVMKSIIIPKHVLDQINTIFYRFLWKQQLNDKKAFEKVKRVVMGNEYDRGGLKMLEMNTFQDSILLEWAESYLSPKYGDWKDLVNIFFKDVGEKAAFKSNLSSKNFKGLKLIPSTFWKSVLVKWLDHGSTVCTDIRPISQYDPIFNNNNIKTSYRQETLFLPSCIRQGILLIKDVMVNDRLMNLAQFKRKYGDYPRSTLDYFMILNTVGIICRQSDISTDESLYFGNTLIGSIGRKNFYKIIRKKGTPLCVGIWNRKFNITVDRDHWEALHELKESKLKALVWKIIHNVYPTNILLFKMRMVASQNCKYCDEVDFVEHFFFNCKKVKPLWDKISRDIHTNLGVSLMLNEKIVLLGVTRRDGLNTELRKEINILLAIGKMVISKFRYGNCHNLGLTFDAECQIRNIT